MKVEEILHVSVHSSKRDQSSALHCMHFIVVAVAHTESKTVNFLDHISQRRQVSAVHRALPVSDKALSKGRSSRDKTHLNRHSAFFNAYRSNVPCICRQNPVF